MRGLVFATLLALIASAGAQDPDRAATLDRAYDEMVVQTAIHGRLIPGKT